MEDLTDFSQVNADWTEIAVTIPAEDTDRAGDIAQMVVPYGIYIEDYSHLEEEAMEIAHIDLIDEALLQKDRTKSVIHVYISPEENPAEAVSFLKERFAAEDIPNEITSANCAEEDWINNWKKYFHPIPVGEKLLIRPLWEDDYDAQGRTVNFENTVIVMTSNAGSNSREALVGFNRTASDISREKAMRALSEFLRPEFLSRVDEVIVFRPLDEADYRKIAVLMLNEYVATLAERGISLKWSEAAVEWIAHKAAGGKSGARDIRSTIRRTVEDKIAALLVEKGEGGVSGIAVVEKDGAIDVESI